MNNKQNKHRSTYSYKHCDYKANHKDWLQQQVEYLHEGVVYSCGLCNYKATKKGHLQQHVKSVHEWVKYNCDHCD